MNEYGIHNAHLHDQINLLQNDKDHLLTHINALKQQVEFNFFLFFSISIILPGRR